MRSFGGISATLVELVEIIIVDTRFRNMIYFLEASIHDRAFTFEKNSNEFHQTLKFLELGDFLLGEFFQLKPKRLIATCSALIFGTGCRESNRFSFRAKLWTRKKVPRNSYRILGTPSLNLARDALTSQFPPSLNYVCIWEGSVLRFASFGFHSFFDAFWPVHLFSAFFPFFVSLPRISLPRHLSSRLLHRRRILSTLVHEMPDRSRAILTAYTPGIYFDIHVNDKLLSRFLLHIRYRVAILISILISLCLIAIGTKNERKRRRKKFAFFLFLLLRFAINFCPHYIMFLNLIYIMFFNVNIKFRIRIFGSIFRFIVA